MPTPFSIAKYQMLPYIGILSFDPAVNASTAGKRAVEPFDIEFCAACMTGAAEEIFNDAPAALSEFLYADQLNPPTPAVFNLTQYSKTIGSITTWAAWMQGCTVRLTGDDVDNQILSQTQLLRPYQGGTSASVSGTVYGDSILLPSSIKSIKDPVRLPTISPLMGTTSREHFLFYIQPHQYGNRQQSPTIFYNLTNKSVGQPAIWLAENAIDIAVAATVKYVRFNPMPNQAYSVTMNAKLKAPVFTAADIYAGTAYAVDPNKAIPMDYHTAIFIPFALQRFTAHPSFDNKAITEIARQYKKAQGMLLDCVPSVTSEPGNYH